MTASLHFFRVFDLAFFAPGALLMSGFALHRESLTQRYLVPDGLARATETAQTIAYLAGLILGSYILGLTCHSIQSLVRWAHQRVRSSDPPTPWYRDLKESPSTDLAHYFWYMRATLSNLAVAALLLAFSSPCSVQTFWLVSIAGLFIFLSTRYDKALTKATSPPVRPDPSYWRYS